MGRQMKTILLANSGFCHHGKARIFFLPFVAVCELVLYDSHRPLSNRFWKKAAVDHVALAQRASMYRSEK